MTALNPYDEVSYSSYPYAQTHPDRLATVAELHGLRAPDVATARVLELGCGAAGNLIAMAVGTPGLRAVGIDLATAPIEEGRRIVAEVGLENVELQQGDLTELTHGELGEFDYVIAHGVLAWVPEPVRDALLAACHSHLAADGLAYISYNAHPGGHVRRIMREAGYWYAGDETDPAARAEKAQELYRLLELRRNADDWWGQLLEATIENFSQAPTYRLVHDELAEHWDPIWFHEFAARAARHGLAYVGDADLAHLLPRRLPPTVAPAVASLVGEDRIGQEQITDILRCTFFRQSVVTRDSRTPADRVRAEALRGLSFAARPGETERREGLLGSVLELLRARLPDTLDFQEIRRGVGSDADAVAAALLEGFEAELVMPHAAPLRAVAPGERPRASPLARWQARGELEVTSLAYTSVRMEEPAARLLLTLLDGTRDRAAIRASFAERTGVRLSAEDLDANLQALGRLFLLTA